jgi:hypothetical protein
MWDVVYADEHTMDKYTLKLDEDLLFACKPHLRSSVASRCNSAVGAKTGPIYEPASINAKIVLDWSTYLDKKNLVATKRVGAAGGDEFRLGGN